MELGARSEPVPDQFGRTIDQYSIPTRTDSGRCLNVRLTPDLAAHWLWFVELSANAWLLSDGIEEYANIIRAGKWKYNLPYDLDPTIGYDHSPQDHLPRDDRPIMFHLSRLSIGVVRCDAVVRANREIPVTVEWGSRFYPANLRRGIGRHVLDGIDRKVGNRLPAELEWDVVKARGLGPASLVEALGLPTQRTEGTRRVIVTPQIAEWYLKHDRSRYLWERRDLKLDYLKPGSRDVDVPALQAAVAGLHDPFSLHRVVVYADRMRRGMWRPGSVLEFGTWQGAEASLLDGRHRLLAVAKTGVSIDAVVRYGRRNWDPCERAAPRSPTVVVHGQMAGRWKAP